MAHLKQIENVVLFVGVIFSNQDSLFKIKQILEKKYGKILFESGDFLFDGTSYYSKEMGENLIKKFFAFEKLIAQDELSKIKNFTNDIEAEFSENGSRKVNLDPGYLNLSKVILASCKDFSHRIYIGNYIFAEITLSYTQGKYVFLPWTYPDFKTEEYLEFFLKLRGWYAKQISLHL